MKQCINGYGMREEEYDLLLDKLYGFEEYYYYKQDKHYKDYLFVINELDKIKHNVPMEESYKNAILGWYIFFKNSKRYLNISGMCFRITDMCQLKCKHCYQQQTPKVNKYMTYDEFVYLFYKHQDIAKNFVHYTYNNIQHIDLEGGETTLNPDLHKIIQFLNNKNIFIHLLTNGIYMPDEVICALKGNKKNSVQISIDGFEKTHDFIRGEGTFKKSISTLKKLVENKIKTSTNITVHEFNCFEYKNLEQYMEKNFNCEMGMMLYIPQNNVLKFLSKKNLNSFLKYNMLKHYNTCNGKNICFAGHTSVIKEDGGFLLCGSGYDYSIANYFTDDDETFLEKVKKFVIRWHSVPVYCFDCKNVSSCLGGMLCTNSWSEICRKFNREDRICHLLNKKENGDMYEIQTIF